MAKSIPALDVVPIEHSFEVEKFLPQQGKGMCAQLQLATGTGERGLRLHGNGPCLGVPHAEQVPQLTPGALEEPNMNRTWPECCRCHAISVTWVHTFAWCTHGQL
jgi:hypothetical protein